MPKICRVYWQYQKASYKADLFHEHQRKEGPYSSLRMLAVVIAMIFFAFPAEGASGFWLSHWYITESINLMSQSLNIGVQSNAKPPLTGVPMSIYALSKLWDPCVSREQANVKNSSPPTQQEDKERQSMMTAHTWWVERCVEHCVLVKLIKLLVYFGSRVIEGEAADCWS